MTYERGTLIMTGLGALLVGAAAAVAVVSNSGTVVPSTDKTAIEKIVREYILAHPEILPEAMQNLQAREMKRQVDAHRAALEAPFASAWQGAADADVTLVEFFDYACGYCRAALPDVERLLAEDKKLRVVYRSIPILGEASDASARVGLALAQQGGNYAVFHHALYGAGDPSEAAVNGALKAAQSNVSTVRAAAQSPIVNAEISSNLELQRALQLTGTPSWVVGDTVLNGAVGYDELKKAIAAARAAKRG